MNRELKTDTQPKKQGQYLSFTAEDNCLNKVISTAAILTLAWYLLFNIDFPNLLIDVVTSHTRLNAEALHVVGG